MTEIPKRLKPKPETLRELFLKSGNLCAFPNCTTLMMNEQGVFIGQVCHIKAAENGGPRFSPAMTNEQRRAPADLMLMCYAHHQVTDDEKKFPVNKLRKMKREHERRFSAPDRAILERLTDWTTADKPTQVKNLCRMNDVLQWRHSDEELSLSVAELNEYIERFRVVPIEVRRFVGAMAQRMHRMRDTSAVHDDLFGIGILISDVRDAFKIGDSTIRKRLSQLESYNLGDLDEINTDLGPQPMIRIINLESGWPTWMDIVAFCEANGADAGHSPAFRASGLCRPGDPPFSASGL